MLIKDASLCIYGKHNILAKHTAPGWAGPVGMGLAANTYKGGGP